MPRRSISVDEKVAIMRTCLKLDQVADTADQHGVAKQSIYQWYQEILASLPEVLTNERPGPKPAVPDPEKPEKGGCP